MEENRTPSSGTSLDELYPVRELPARLERALGRRLNRTTTWRWILRGVGGARLRVVRAGRTSLTCDPWVFAFLDGVEKRRERVKSPPSRRGRPAERAHKTTEVLRRHGLSEGAA